MHASRYTLKSASGPLYYSFCYDAVPCIQYTKGDLLRDTWYELPKIVRTLKSLSRKYSPLFWASSDHYQQRLSTCNNFCFCLPLIISDFTLSFTSFTWGVRNRDTLLIRRHAQKNGRLIFGVTLELRKSHRTVCQSTQLLNSR